MDLKERFRHFWIVPVLLLTCATLSACTPTDEDVFVQEVPERPEDSEEDTNNDNSNENMESKTIRLTVDDRTFTATLEKNSSAEALITFKSVWTIMEIWRRWVLLVFLYLGMTDKQLHLRVI